MDIIVVEVLFPVQGKEKALLNALHKLTQIAKSSSGCTQYDLLIPIEGSSGFMIIMRFDAEENLKKHEESEYIAAFVKENEDKTYSNFTYSKWKEFSP